MMPRRIQRKRTKGWRMPEGAVYVGRQKGNSTWGNPYVVGEQARIESASIFDHESIYVYSPVITPEIAVLLFRIWVVSRPGLVQQIRGELAGRDLVCWCPLEDGNGNRVPCHADVLLELSNGAV